MRANEKRSFVLKNLTSNRIRAYRIPTYETPAKYCKVRLFMEFLSRTLSRKVSNRLVKLPLFVFVLFLKLVSLYFDKLQVYFTCAFYEVQRVANLRKFTIYIIAIESSICKYQFLLQF